MTQAPYPPPAYQPPPPAHRQATTVLVLGILGIVVCGLCGPFAWAMGNRVVAEIDASRGAVGGRQEANIGRILGIVATVLLIAGVAFFVLAVALLGTFSITTHG
jgi:uncharacterized membrane protein YjgN (DUF898 family)